MYTHQPPGQSTGTSTDFQQPALSREFTQIRQQGLQLRERIDEIMMMCDRDHPVYEQISSFGIALYALGCFECQTLLDVPDIDACEAGRFLQADFMEIPSQEISPDHNIMESRERYLLVVGDPLFPEHFAVVTDCRRPRPFFSKLPFFGSGFDSMAELKKEFTGIDGLSEKDIYFFKRKQEGGLKQKSAKIYTLNNDGNYSVWEYQYATK